MMRAGLMLASLLALAPPALPLPAAHAEDLRAGASRPIDNWADLRAAFVRCWQVPEGAAGSVIAFRFLFAPNGGLRGPPLVPARVLKGEPEARARYEGAAYAMLDRCLPIAATPGFRAVMGEALIQLRLVDTPREPALNLGPSMTIFSEEAGRGTK